MHGHRLDSPKKNRIVGSMMAGLSASEASILHNTHIRTCQRVYQHFQSMGTTHYNKPAGRTKKLNMQQQERLIDLAITYRRMSLEELGYLIQLERQTVRKYLNAHGYHRRKARHKPMLKPHHKVLRLRFAIEYKVYNLF